MKSTLLELLRKQKNTWLTMESLQHVTGWQPKCVQQEVARLTEQLHYAIEVSPQGYRLIQGPSRLSSEAVEYGLDTHHLGRKILVYDQTDSTNDIAWQYAREDGSDGLVVLSEFQRKGRGRFHRTWAAPPGSSILMSILFQEKAGYRNNYLTLIGGLAVAQAIEILYELEVCFQWPNDVQVQGKKAAGILVESRQIGEKKYFVLGIGINCLQTQEQFPAELRPLAISLQQAAQRKIERIELTQEVLGSLDQWLECLQTDASAQEKLHDAWLGRFSDLGRRIQVVHNGRAYCGQVMDVTLEDGLVLRLDEGIVRCFDASTTTTSV